MIENYIGIDSDFILIGIGGIALVLLVICIINAVTLRKMKKNYKQFMKDKDGQSLEELIVGKLDLIDGLTTLSGKNEKEIAAVKENLKTAYQKAGLIKYDAFHEMGGKLSFTLALLTEENDGFVMNAMHSREGCYTYIKEIIAGNSIIALGEEEKEALDMALNNKLK
ncbi:MAG: DUF4446 family protein [Lachnospiraceae bacterium]